jgi:hypothetical protein
MPIGSSAEIVSSGGGVTQQAPATTYPWPALGQSDALGNVNRVASEAMLPSFEFDRWTMFGCANLSAITTIGFPISGLLTPAGTTRSASTPVIGSIRGEESRILIAQTAGANAASFFTQPMTALYRAQAWRGNAVGRGGFSFHMRFGFGALTANARIFFGLTDSLNAGSVFAAADPSTVNASTIGVGADQADGTISIIVNNATATAQKIALTTARNKVGGGDVQNNLYDLWIGCAPNDTQIYVYLQELSGTNYTRTVLFSQFITAAGNQLPLATAFMRPEFGANSGANAVDVQNWEFVEAVIRWKAS